MSILKVDTINEKTTGNGVAIPGHVIQVVHNTTATTVTYSSTTAAFSGLEATITPKQQNSKILIQVKQHARFQSTYDQGIGFTLYRGSTSIFNSATSYDVYHYDGDTTAVTDVRNRYGFDVYDTHNTTSAITYQVYLRCYRFDYTPVLHAQADNNESQITCWEIAQ